MNARKVALGLVVCLAAAVASAQNIVSNFASKTLRIELQRYPFGTALDSRFQPVANNSPPVTNIVATGTNVFASGFVVSPLPSYFFGPPLGTNGEFAWYQNAEAANYSWSFPARNLLFGFKDGRLAAIRVSLHSPGSKEWKADMIKVQDAVRAASREAKAAGHTSATNIETILGEFRPIEDGQYRLRYLAMCGPNESSLFTSTVQITPIEKPK